GNVEKSPPVQDLLRALEKGGILSFSGVPPAAHAFLTGLIRKRFPECAIVVVAEGLKAQEGLQQDIETWLPKPLFFPAWEVPPTAPWPIRLEFFGDDLDSLRSFDPITQISREAVGEAVIPPAGELGLLKKFGQSATLLDHLPADTIFMLPDPDRLAEVAAEYESQVPANDPLSVGWQELLKNFPTRLELSESARGLPQSMT